MCATIAGCVLLLVRLAGAQPAAGPPAPPETATYVGSEICQACHQDLFDAFARNPHHALESKPEWKGKSCEACHGPGSLHAASVDKKDIRNPSTLPAEQSDRICLTCHLNQPTHSGRIQSSHAKHEVACVSCHTMHGAPAELVSRQPADINRKCASCHVSEWTSFLNPYRHKLPEGAMSCVDCHNPHGRNLTPTVRAVAAAGEPSCYNCHGEKRGPFVYEHEPIRTDGCTACHEPHGSANPRMLTRNQERVVCLECHANVGAPQPANGSVLGNTPPSFHDLRNPRYQTCADCHVKIHGSNVSRDLLK
jgi:DmsE family decaheme c-type cytochrome